MGSSIPFKALIPARHQWLTPIILTTQEAEIRRIMVQSQPRQTVHETLSWNTQHKTGLLSGSRCRPWVQTPVPQHWYFVNKTSILLTF
jgi:hypothetical protein